jgi:hypothetical protein
MKTDLQALIDTAKALCDKLEEAARQEEEFCFDLQNEFEKMSWEIFRMAEDLKQIQHYVG